MIAPAAQRRAAELGDLRWAAGTSQPILYQQSCTWQPRGAIQTRYGDGKRVSCPRAARQLRSSPMQDTASKNQFQSGLDAAKIGIGFANTRSINVNDGRDIPLSRN